MLFVFSRIVVRLDDLGEVGLAFWTDEAVLVPVPFVLAGVAVDNVSLAGVVGIAVVHDYGSWLSLGKRYKDGAIAPDLLLWPRYGEGRCGMLPQSLMRFVVCLCDVFRYWKERVIAMVFAQCKCVLMIHV